MRNKKLTIKMLYNILLSISVGQRFWIKYPECCVSNITLRVDEKGSLIFDLTDTSGQISKCGEISEFIRSNDLRNSKENVYVKSLRKELENIIDVYEDENDHLNLEVKE